MSFRLASCLLGLLMLACSSPDKVSGGSDHPNEITGEVLTSAWDNKSVDLSQAQVRLFAYGDSTSVSTLVSTVSCDSIGGFQFSITDSGVYYLEAISGDSTEVALGPVFEFVSGGTHVDSLSLLEAVSITVYYAEADANPSCEKALWLSGTHYVAEFDSTAAAFSFPVIPQGLNAKLVDLNGCLLYAYEVPSDSSISSFSLGIVEASQTSNLYLLTSNSFSECQPEMDCPDGQSVQIETTDSFGCVSEWTCVTDSTTE
ncbi:MAG TPA: hypothetical protein VLM37_00020 [Fibrobacteraceae bacterium]|nr:hypothetical protein [Fibrobacteraceae bacterium]